MVMIRNWSESNRRIEQFKFSDGSVWSTQDILNNISGTDGQSLGSLRLNGSVEHRQQRKSYQAAENPPVSIHASKTPGLSVAEDRGPLSPTARPRY